MTSLFKNLSRLLLLSFILISCGEKIIDGEKDGDYKRDVLYFEGSPYSGTALSHYENGQLWKKRFFKKGKRDGVFEYYYKDGQIESIQPYKNGNYNTQELKRMVGYRTDRIFHSYYKLKEEIHNKPNTPFLKSLKSDSNSILSTPIENTESIEVSRIDKLKEDFKQGLISKEFFEKMYEKLMMS